MNKNYIKVLSLALLVGLIFGCSKDESTGVSENPLETKLKANVWIATGLTVNGNDFFQSVDACQKDDLYEFKSDSVLVRSESTLVCEDSDPGPFISEWYFDENYTQLTFENSDYEILELTATDLKLQQKSSTGAVIIATFEKN